MMDRRGLLGLLAGMLPLAARAQSGPQPELPKEKLVIVTRDGKRHAFNVEMAVAPEHQTIGLMFRTSVPPDGGMLFDWGTPRVSQMWMRYMSTSEAKLMVPVMLVMGLALSRRVAEAMAWPCSSTVTLAVPAPLRSWASLTVRVTGWAPRVVAGAMAKA